MLSCYRLCQRNIAVLHEISKHFKVGIKIFGFVNYEEVLVFLVPISHFIEASDDILKGNILFCFVLH